MRVGTPVELYRYMRAWTVMPVLWMWMGCATITGPVYAPPEAAWEVPPPEGVTMDALVQNARAQGWTLVDVDRSGGTVEALTPVDRAQGVATRERWRFVVEDGRVSVEKALEMEMEPGVWESTTEICAGYRYAREREQLRRISALVVQHQATVTVVASATPPRRQH